MWRMAGGSLVGKFSYGRLPVLLAPRIGRMTLGEKLLELTAEYQQRKDAEVFAPGEAAGRTTAEIGAEYEQTLRDLLAS